MFGKLDMWIFLRGFQEFRIRLKGIMHEKYALLKRRINTLDESWGYGMSEGLITGY